MPFEENFSKKIDSYLLLKAKPWKEKIMISHIAMYCPFEASSYPIRPPGLDWLVFLTDGPSGICEKSIAHGNDI